jgi:hypothetical protein
VRDADGSKITMELLKETSLAPNDRLQLLEDALGGEKYLAGRMEGEEKYLAKLGFGIGDTSASQKPPEPPREQKAAPFTRNPHNDPTGLDNVDPSKGRAA